VPAKLKLASEKTISASAAKLLLLKRLHCTLKFEKMAWQSGARLIALLNKYSARERAAREEQ